jgi:hypothetical protein
MKKYTPLSRFLGTHFKAGLSITLRRLRTSWRKNIPGIIWGIVATSFLSFLAWVLAYFGFIDLGLPQRFEFEKLDNLIRNEVPPQFSYTIQKASIRTAEYESLIVTARDRRAYEIDNRGVQSDIILILDRTGKTYNLSYKFTPKLIDESYNAPLHAINISLVDLDNDKLKEVVLGWSYIGANYSPPYITVMTARDKNKKLKLLSVPRLRNYNYPKDYTEPRMTNGYDPLQEIRVDAADNYFVKDGAIAIENRSDDSCRACEEDHIYNINTFNLTDKGMVEWYEPVMNIKGWEELKTYLKNRAFDLEKYN